jgi:hypothetical protein
MFLLVNKFEKTMKIEIKKMEEAKKLVDKDIDDLERYFSESSLNSDDEDPPESKTQKAKKLNRKEKRFMLVLLNF